MNKVFASITFVTLSLLPHILISQEKTNDISGVYTNVDKLKTLSVFMGDKELALIYSCEWKIKKTDTENSGAIFSNLKKIENNQSISNIEIENSKFKANLLTKNDGTLIFKANKLIKEGCSDNIGECRISNTCFTNSIFKASFRKAPKTCTIKVRDNENKTYFYDLTTEKKTTKYLVNGDKIEVLDDVPAILAGESHAIGFFPSRYSKNGISVLGYLPEVDFQCQ